MVMTPLEQAKHNFDVEMDKAEAIMLDRWRAYVASRLNVAKEVSESTAMVCWHIPLDIAQEITSAHTWPPGSEITTPEEMHVTLKYLGEVDENIIADVMEHVSDLVGSIHPFDIVLKDIDVFTGVEEGTMDAVHISVESPVLRQLKYDIERAIGHLREETHPVYNPHITLAYVPAGSEWSANIVESTITADNLSVARGGKFVDFPLLGVFKGGKGSGHHGHSGRPGQIGGSSSGRDTMSLYSAIALYTENSPINIDLREGRELDSVSEDIINAIDKGFKPSPEDMIVYRGVDIKSPQKSTEVFGTTHLVPGHIFSDAGYTSTSTNLNVAKGFGNTLIRIHVSKGDQILDTKGISNWIGEREILLPRESMFEFIGKTYDETRDILYNDVKLVSDVITKQLNISEANKKFLMEVRMEIHYEQSDALAEQVFNGDITIGRWQEEMKALIKGTNTSIAAIAKGGWDAMGPRDWGRLGTPTRQQYKFLAGFAETLDEKRDILSLNYIKNRARMYGEAIYALAVQTEAGFWFEDELPWLPKDGSTTCLVRCHCYWKMTILETRKQFRVVEAKWVLGEADHCEASENKDGCVERAGHTEILKVPIDVEVPHIIGGY